MTRSPATERAALPVRGGSRHAALAALLASMTLTACAGDDSGPPADGGGAETVAVREFDVELGPADGHELPGEALDRVAVGDTAPDFTLMSLAGDPVTLSDYRGAKTVLLVFYRGHW